MNERECKKILGEVLEEVKPDESVLKRCNSVIALINKEIKSRKIRAKATLGGSIAKGTFLRDDYDCDVFVRFGLKLYKDKDISAHLMKILQKFNPKTLNGSRDYYQFEKDGIKFEVVPVLDIRNSGEARNVMDVSPLHVAWIRRRIDRKPKLADEVRLARAFCKANGVYGAESFINGFSGHVIDILTIHYGGFINLLSSASKWKSNEKNVIDPENHHRGKALFNLNTSKTEGPLVLVDPVQKDRNASASLSYEKFEIFKKAAGEFLKNPKKKFFEATSVEHNEKGWTNADVIPLSGKEDVIGCKILKAFIYIEKKLSLNGFVVEKKNWEWDKGKKAVFFYKISADSLKKALASGTVITGGPPIEMKANTEAFKKKYKKTFIREKRIFAEVKRKFRNPKQLFESLKNDKYLNGQIKQFKLIN
ncbi:MAG: nucleotidyltransferase domain-containing protein [Candidatus Woesearchaeota archaeon]|nr:nucleotidyltransferase domain-containing protein [Candidatus Woesearchaeota archaeon]